MLALDHAAGDIFGDGFDDRRDVVGFGEHDPAEPGVLHEPIHPLVAPHQDMGDNVDPQPRRLALADPAIEQIDLLGNLRKQRVERLVENFEPRDFGIAQVDHHAGTVRRLDSRPPQRIAQPHRTDLGGGVAPGIRRVCHGLAASQLPRMRLPLTYQ